MDARPSNTHVKLLAFDFVSLTPNPAYSSTYLRKGVRLSRAESVGVVVTRDFKPGKFLRFTIDDGTGCIPCILWLNHLTSPYFSRRSPSNLRSIALMAQNFASDIQLGVVARVRGRITDYRGEVQITVSDVALERDPNAQVLHWLDCVRVLNQQFYEPQSLSRNLSCVTFESIDLPQLQLYEVFRNEDYDTKVDVFSFALILQELIEGCPPFAEKQEHEVPECYAAKERPPFNARKEHYVNGLKELIEDCWSENPADRPTFAQIILRLEAIHNRFEGSSCWEFLLLDCIFNWSEKDSSV